MARKMWKNLEGGVLSAPLALTKQRLSGYDGFALDLPQISVSCGELCRL
jgi:hypothetical protein